MVSSLLAEFPNRSASCARAWRGFLPGGGGSGASFSTSWSSSDAITRLDGKIATRLEMNATSAGAAIRVRPAPPISGGMRSEKKSLAPQASAHCALCGRAIPPNAKSSLHHLVPKLKGGARLGTVRLHQICHAAIHARYTEAEIARRLADPAALRADPELARFVAWVRTKPDDFQAPTRRRGGTPPGGPDQGVGPDWLKRSRAARDLTHQPSGSAPGFTAQPRLPHPSGRVLRQPRPAARRHLD